MSPKADLQPMLEERLEELTFLAEAISEQVSLIDSFQNQHILAHRGEGAEDDAGPVANALSAFQDELQQMLQQFETQLRQREELNCQEADLSRREEKLAGQKKSLVQRFRAERAQLQLDKELLSRQNGQENPALPQSSTEPSTPVSRDSLSELESRLKELTDLLEECDEENRKLSAENQELRGLFNENPPQVGEDASTHVAEIFDLRRQLEITLDELQESRNELNRLKSDGGSLTAKTFSWEDQKRALLASLEDESSQEQLMNDPVALLESLKASEDRGRQQEQTIEQLEMLLREYEEGTRSEEDASHREKCQQLFDESEVIAAEKARLVELEQEWRDKIGVAEIELSKERARLARDQAALEEQRRELEEQLASDEESPANERPKKRRWMERLGLA